jgi:pimeloyl-ACP methyl ester carboxylesterase
MSPSSHQMISTPLMNVAYESAGDAYGFPVILLHGFPYDVRAFDGVVARLEALGAWVVVPYLRGFGPTRFLSPNTVRSGQQAALGCDLIDLMDALNVERAVVAGYDWGGRAACIAAALWPQRVTGLLSVGGYNIQHLASAQQPAPPAYERSYWYQYYFHSERGRRGLQDNRDDLCELLWTTWSPTWAEASAAFPSSAASLHNPDFVDVVIHSYRHRYGLVDGDQRYDHTEQALAAEPTINVPTVVISSGADGVLRPDAAEDRDHFTGPYEQVHLPDVGHNVPQEAPTAFADAIKQLLTAEPHGS